MGGKNQSANQKNKSNAMKKGGQQNANVKKSGSGGPSGTDATEGGTATSATATGQSPSDSPDLNNANNFANLNIAAAISGMTVGVGG